MMNKGAEERNKGKEQKERGREGKKGKNIMTKSRERVRERKKQR